MEQALARVDYNFYVEYVHRGFYQHAAHTRYMGNILQEAEMGLHKRLVFTLPPRHSKSMTISETFPSFFIGKNPDRNVIGISYGHDLAHKFGRANRTKIIDYGQQLFNIKIDGSRGSATNWGIEDRQGGMISAGIMGGVTGQGADLLLIDDPIKNKQQADSLVYRDRVWEEWKNTLLTRIHPNAIIIIILTRWHEDDLVGRILAEEGDKWRVIKFPAIAEEADILGRQIGDALWPGRGYDLTWLKAQEKSVDAYTWNALYQQRPAPPEGTTIKRQWLKYYTSPPGYFDRILQSWDCSFKKTSDGSFVVGQVWGVKSPNKYLIDQVKARMDFPETINAISNMLNKYPNTRATLIEDKANGPAVIDTLRRKFSAIIPIDPQGGKEARLNAVAPEFEGGNVYLPSTVIAPWVGQYVEELVSFPHAQYDDQVDATSQLLNYLGGSAGAILLSRKPRGW